MPTNHGPRFHTNDVFNRKYSDKLVSSVSELIYPVAIPTVGEKLVAHSQLGLNTQLYPYPNLKP